MQEIIMIALTIAIGLVVAGITVVGISVDSGLVKGVLFAIGGVISMFYISFLFAMARRTQQEGDLDE